MSARVRNIGRQSGAGPAAASTLPPELSGTIPRNVRLTAGGIAVIVAAVMMAVAALAVAMGLSVAYIRSVEGQLRDGGSVAVEARVEDVSLRRGENPRRVVTYTYDVDGTTHTGRVALRPRDRRAFAVGGSIPINYLSSRPDTSWATDYEPGRFPLWLIPLVSIALLAGGAGLGCGVRRQWILLSEGRAAHARVTGQKRVHKDHQRAYRVSYEFQALSGSTHTAHFDAGNSAPPIGSLVPIVYHRDRPQWSARYPLPLVRPSRSAHSERLGSASRVRQV